MTHLRYILIALSLLCGIISASAAEEQAKPKSKPSFEVPDFSLFSQGKYVYEKHCVVCHGEKGDGKGTMGITLDIRPRDFRSGLFKYKSTANDLLPTTDDLYRTVSSGITGTAMPIFSHLPERDRRAVVEYVKFFSPRWNNPKNHGTPLPRAITPDWMDDGDKLKAHRTKGAELFTLTCAPCHGPKGEGNGPNAAQLKDHWDFPIKPGNLRAEQLRQGQEMPDWYRVVTQGITGTPMPTFAETLTEEQRWQIVAYLQQLRSEPVSK
ncbi:MAG TPA: cytochrome c [Verrucomicrobiae bacterium]